MIQPESGFISVLKQMAEDRGLDINVIITTLESALLSAYKKYQPGNQDVEIKINPDTGGINILESRTVVDEINKSNRDKEIILSDAKLKYPDANIGDLIKIERDPKDFGRIAAQTARQVISQRLREAERSSLYSTLSDKVGDLVTGTIFKVEGDNVIVRLNEKTDGVLPRKERIAGEKYLQGDEFKFYVLEVKQMPKGPRIMLSRTHPGLLRRLLELEVPEIQQGIIEIVNIVRDAGARAKVAIKTIDPGVDPVGACVGNAGERIRHVSSALKNEKIDIIVWNNDPLAFIKVALSPAQIARIEPDLINKNSAKVYVYPDQLSLAIGKAGQNVKLAAKLTNWKIDIISLEPDRMPTLRDIFHEAFENK